jgi:hypothetical protein
VREIKLIQWEKSLNNCRDISKLPNNVFLESPMRPWDEEDHSEADHTVSRNDYYMEQLESIA